MTDQTDKFLHIHTKHTLYYFHFQILKHGHSTNNFAECDPFMSHQPITEMQMYIVTSIYIHMCV